MMKLFRIFIVATLCMWSLIVQGQNNSEFQLAEDMEVTITLGDLYMNCGDALTVSDSDMKSLVFDKLGQNGLSKQGFESAFDLDRESGQWARRYYKSGTSYKLAVGEREAEAKNYLSSYTAENNWFGRVWYTPFNSGTSNVLVWNLTDDNQKGGMNYYIYEKFREVSRAESASRGMNTNRVSTVVRFVNKGTGKSIWVTLLLQAGKIHFEYGSIENKDWMKWSDNLNTNLISLSSSEDKNIILTKYWSKPSQMIKWGDTRSFSNFYGNYSGGMLPTVHFAFTYPIRGVNSFSFSANNNTWVVEGASGTKWTLTIRSHNSLNENGTSAIVAIKKDNVNYGPEEIAYLDGNDNIDRLEISNTTFHLCGIEDNNSTQYPAATDLIKSSNIFIAYLKVNVYHYCYDPLIENPYFNLNIEGLGNQKEQEYLNAIQEMKESCNAVKALIDNKYSEFTEGKLLVADQLKNLQRYFYNEYYKEIDEMLKKLNDAEENVNSLSSESFDELKNYITYKVEYILSYLSSYFSLPVATSFTCNEGGMFRVGDIEVRNGTKTIYIFTDKLLYFDDILVVPDEGYRIASLKINNKETTDVKFDFYYAGSTFVAEFEPILDTSPKRTIHVETPGTLSNLIPSSEKYYIEDLTLTGELNGDDFYLLRDMAGGGWRYLEGTCERTEGKLEYLDISGTRIVKGGGSYLYYRYKEDEKFIAMTNSDVIPDYLFVGCTLKSIILPNSVTAIGCCAFEGCSVLTSIMIPNSVVSIGGYAFYGTAWYNLQADGLVYAGKVVYRYKGEIPSNTKVSIKDGTLGIADGAFDYCHNITSITIPNSIINIGSAAFQSCGGLTSITIPNSVTSIGDFVFSGCSGLTSITIPNSVKSIGNYAFQSCNGLTSITIPNSVTSIGDAAFLFCSGLKDVISEIKTPFEISDNVYSVYSTAKLTVPKGTKSTYQSTNYWNKFSNIVEASGNIDEWLKEIQEMKNTCEYLLASYDKIIYDYRTVQADYFAVECKSLIGNTSSFHYNLDYYEKMIEDGSMTEEVMQEVREEYERIVKYAEEMWKLYDDANSNTVQAIFQCNEGGFIKLGYYKTIDNKQETIIWSTIEKLKFIIEVLPKDGYRIKSIFINGVPVSGSSFSSTDIKGDFIVEFEEQNSFGKVADVIDLGLSVKWASWNIGASKIGDYGGLYGIGDPTGIETTHTFSAYYYSEGESICGTQYDLATVKWKGEWRLPSFEELEELKNNCTWEFNVVIDGIQGCRATGPNGNWIFIPYAGSRSTSNIEEIVSKGSLASLWSGDILSSSPKPRYKDLDIFKSGKFQTDGGDIFFGQSIRPVYGENMGTITISVNDCSREYGESNPFFEYTVTGGSINGTPKITCSATKTSPVGTYTIKIEKGSVTNSNVTFVDGALTITKAPLKITAKSYTRMQGEANPSFDVIYSGFKNGETSSVLTRKPTCYTSATSNSPVGTYAITVSGAEAQNYSIEYKNGTLTVTDGGQVYFTQQSITYLGSISSQTAEVQTIGSDVMNVEIPSSVSYNGRTYQVISIANGVLSNRKFNYVSLPSTITSLNANTFYNSVLGALIWKADASLPSSVFTSMWISTKSNFLLYVNSESYAPSNVSNVIVGSTAKNITLTDGTSTRFYCPRTFTAQSITYTHHYGMTTGGNGKGWETIALPFDVQRIEHSSKGLLTPFFLYQIGRSQRPFWLYELGSNGFRRTSAIMANTPYIIAMPNDSKYDDEYILAGDVTFSATNAYVYQTGSLVKPSSNGKTFIPNFAVVNPSSSIYALNVNNNLASNYSSYDAGSIFINNLREIYPFEAYMTTSSSGARTLTVDFEDNATAIEVIPTISHVVDDVKVYSLNGTLLIQTDCETLPKQWEILPAGVYIVNGKKIVK